MTKSNQKKNKTAAASQAMGQKRTGDYALPTNRPVISRNRGPVMTSVQGGRGVIVSNTERLSGGTVNGDATLVYKKTGYPLNPASPIIFPWLANIAKGYQMYRWKSLKISYVPAVATTEPGYVEAGVFYDQEDYARWFADTVDYSSLSLLGDYATGPPYAGGQLSTVENRRDSNNTNWFGVCPDVVAAHRRYPWLTVDDFPDADHTRNLAVGAYAAFQTYAISGGNRVWGIPFVSYEIEFIHPTVPYFNTTPPSLKEVQVEGESGPTKPDCTGGCDPFPPSRPPPGPSIPPGEGL